ncbi:hypothetical protein F5Y19DRAFT_486198 [Xylariaceae sp. FL1651]|nr:hypothetical protein F5Y19DRAFT_486198 [Xylariaceae sp. FL1651]
MAARTKIELIPWDHRSETHITRMIAQRETCGWDAEKVPSWALRAERGLKTMFWVTLANSLPDRDEMLNDHKNKHPNEVTPLQDTAATVNLISRVPSGINFVPVGHVALNKNPAPDLEGHLEGLLPEDGVHWITSLYISTAFQRHGIGRAVMSHLEFLVAKLPSVSPSDNDEDSEKDTVIVGGHEGPIMVLDTIPTEVYIGEWAAKNFWNPLGLAMPKISTQEWYESQGYEIFACLPDHRTMPLPTGFTINVPILMLKKVLR